MVSTVRSYLVNEGAKIFVLVSWLLLNAAVFYFTFFHYYFGPQYYYLHEMLGYGLCISRASAACINLNACLILLPMCRNVLTLIRSLSGVCRQCRRLIDKSKSFHMASGYMICAMSVLHCCAHSFNAFNFCANFNKQFVEVNVASSPHQSPFLFFITSVPGITGIMMVTCLLTIAITASSPLRRRSYRRFWKLHHLFIIFYLLLLFHAFSGVLKYQTNLREHIPGCYQEMNGNGATNETNTTLVLPEPEAEHHPRKDIFVFGEPIPEPESHFDRPGIPLGEVKPEPFFRKCDQPHPKFSSCRSEAWMWMGVPIFLYVLERLSRHFGPLKKSIDVIGVVEHPHDVIEIEFMQKDLKARPGQSVWIRCPDVSHIESHPFTLTALPTEDKPTFTVHMLVLGEWTMAVKRLLSGINHLHSLPDRNEICKTSSSVQLGNRRTDELFSEVNESCFQSNTQLQQYESNRTNATTVEYTGANCTPHLRPPTFYLYGPHGSAMQDIFEYKVGLCVAGGIGITPFAAILNMILRQKGIIERCKLQRMYVVWSCKTLRSFEWFIELIGKVQQYLWDSNRPDFLSVSLHVTRNVGDIERQDFLSSVRPFRCRFEKGRPDMTKFIFDLSQRHYNTTVGVFCCGPKLLNSSVRKICMSSKLRNKVTFIFNKECF